MHINLDTSQPLSERDRRVLAALIGVDTPSTSVPRSLFANAGESHPDGGHTPATTPPPLPVPVPPGFAAKLGDAVAQFSPRGPATEARLPFAQQAGVRTSSTMPDDDGETPPRVPGVEYVPGPQMRALMDQQRDASEPTAGEPAAPDEGERVFGVDLLDSMTTVVTGAVRDGKVYVTDMQAVHDALDREQPTDDDFEAAISHAIETATPLRDGPLAQPHVPDVREHKRPVVEQPPVRHTTP